MIIFINAISGGNFSRLFASYVYNNTTQIYQLLGLLTMCMCVCVCVCVCVCARARARARVFNLLHVSIRYGNFTYRGFLETP